MDRHPEKQLVYYVYMWFSQKADNFAHNDANLTFLTHSLNKDIQYYLVWLYTILFSLIVYNHKQTSLILIEYI